MTYLPWKKIGLLYFSGKLPTYPSPKPIFCPNWEVSVDVGLGEGWMGSLETYNNPENQLNLLVADYWTGLLFQALRLAMTKL